MYVFSALWLMYRIYNQSTDSQTLWLIEWVDFNAMHCLLLYAVLTCCIYRSTNWSSMYLSTYMYIFICTLCIHRCTLMLCFSLTTADCIKAISLFLCLSVSLSIFIEEICLDLDKNLRISLANSICIVAEL